MYTFMVFIRHKHRRWPVRTWQCLASYRARRLVGSALHIDLKQNSSNRLHAPTTPCRILEQVSIVYSNDQLLHTYPLQGDRSKVLKVPNALHSSLAIFSPSNKISRSHSECYSFDYLKQHTFLTKSVGRNQFIRQSLILKINIEIRVPI